MNEAIKTIQTQPWVPIEVWCKAVGVGRNTAYRLAKLGEIEGLYRIGSQYRIESSPWRRRFGLNEGVAA